FLAAEVGDAELRQPRPRVMQRGHVASPRWRGLAWVESKGVKADTAADETRRRPFPIDAVARVVSPKDRPPEGALVKDGRGGEVLHAGTDAEVASVVPVMLAFEGIHDKNRLVRGGRQCGRGHWAGSP